MMDRNWTELAWLEWTPPEDAIAPRAKGFQRIGSVRPEALAKIMLMLLRWETEDRSIFRVVTESGAIIAGNEVESFAREPGFPFRIPAPAGNVEALPIRG
ncbi:hypothetical protein FHT19_003275 [Novosphingobium sp. SG919]|nr:hypothetical protein [Novosphingobium sp. SG919]